MKLLRHFVPNTTLDLKNMKAMIAEMEAKGEITQPQQTQQEQEQQLALPTVPTEPPEAMPTSNETETEESEVLQEELGCMIIDARGSYRYVGADSYIRFAHAAQAAHIPTTRRKDAPAVMIPMLRTILPPATPESVHSRGSDKGYNYKTHPDCTLDDNRWDNNNREKTYYLPDRDICQRYAMRFFDEIQSIYWFYSPEQFYTLVDKTYADGGVGSSASWLCSLYCVFAICSQKEEAAAIETLTEKRDKKSSEYLAMAKSMGLQVCDEADTDAVRALSLMSLALHSHCFTVTAYLIIGMTVRISYSLGIHRDISPTLIQDSVSRARVHRLWWTVYLLDQEVAIQLGYPCAVVDDQAGIQTPLACESILDPGRTTPHGYQAACVSLIKLKKKISHTLYVTPALSTRKVPFSAVTACIGDLRDWLAKLPPHLCWSPVMAPSHRRAVAVLHLRYWTTLIHVQRPFLLYTMTRRKELARSGEDKKRWYEELSHLCVDAAEKAVAIVRTMREYDVLSSLVLFDSQCIQELVQVLLLVSNRQEPEWKARGQAAKEGIDMLMETFRGMEAVGWCEKILPELTAQVEARRRTSVVVDDGMEGVQDGFQQPGQPSMMDVRVVEVMGEEGEERPDSRHMPGAFDQPQQQPMDAAFNEGFFGSFQDFE